MLRASSSNQYFKPLTRLAIELNPMLRYPACHPSVSKWFRRAPTRFLFEERADPSRYFHRRKAIVTFGTQH
jgi:hypothetical protein